MTPHDRGFLLTLSGVLLLTPDTLLVRLVDTDPWTMAAWRGLLTGGSILVGFTIVRGRDAYAEVRALGAAGLAVSALYAVNATTFVVALHYTSVANTLVILATTPLIAAALSFTVLGPRTVAAPEVALLLLLETVLGPLWVWLGVGERPGNAAALGGAIVVATLMVHSLWRLRRQRPAQPA